MDKSSKIENDNSKPRHSKKTIAEKLAIIKEVDKKNRRKLDIAKEYNIPVSTLSTYLRMRDTLMKYASEDVAKNTGRLRIRGGKYSALEGDLVEWYCQALATGTKIAQKTIKDKACEIAVNLNIAFKPTSGWLTGFLSRYNIKLITPSKRKSNYSDKVETNAIDSEILSILNNYNPEDVYNMERFNLFYLSNKPENSVVSNICVILCCNREGSKLAPSFIGKEPMSESNSTDCCYFYNESATLTPILFREWLLHFEKETQTRNRKILLILDDSDPFRCDNIKLENIQLLYTMADKSLLLRPFDHGIIKQFKHNFRKENELSPINKIGWKLYKFIEIINDIWNNLDSEFLKDCFTISGFPKKNTAIEAETNEDLESDQSSNIQKSSQNDMDIEAVFCSTSMDDVFDVENNSQTQTVHQKNINTSEYIGTCFRNDPLCSKDEHDIYSQSVANRIRNLKNDYLVAIARNKIDQVLFEVEMMKFQKEEFHR